MLKELIMYSFKESNYLKKVLDKKNRTTNQACMRYLFLLLIISLNSCNHKKETTKVTEELPEVQSNISPELLQEMQWMNPPTAFELVENTLSISVEKDTDFFNNPEDGSVVGTAPLLYQEVEGDFVAKVWVKPDFSSQWNAVSMMIHQDSLHWIKFAFESSDATGPSIVSVVTKESSDDANGAVLNDQESIWLAIARKGDIYAMHWSMDGINYNMTRLTAMPAMTQVKVGVEAQSPVGEQATHQLLFFEIEKRTVKNLRNLNE